MCDVYITTDVYITIAVYSYMCSSCFSCIIFLHEKFCTHLHCMKINHTKVIFQKFLTTKITRITELHELHFRNVLANDLCRYTVAADQYTPGFLDVISLHLMLVCWCVGHDQNVKLIGKHVC